MSESELNAAFPVPPVCRATVDRLQLVLDGELPAAAIDADPHLPACPACRARLTAARLVLSALAMPGEIPIPSGMADGILSAVREERFARIRRRSYAWAGGLALAIAASLLLVAWFTRSSQSDIVPLPDLVNGQPAPTPPVAPDPRPVRIGDELSKVGLALRGSSKPITEPVGTAPQMFAMLTGSLTRPIGPVAEFEPARKSLTELPDAARVGLEPVTATTQKAFARLMRDVGAVQVSKPKS